MKTRKKMRRRKKRKRIGISQLLITLLLLAALLPANAKEKKKPALEAYGLVGVSVFRDPGIALPNAEVTLAPSPQQEAAPVKLKKMQGTTDSRGECVFRVPTAAISYTVKVNAKGYHAEEKPVKAEGEVRVDVTFVLHEESK
jgi:hypothetical protein